MNRVAWGVLTVGPLREESIMGGMGPRGRMRQRWGRDRHGALTIAPSPAICRRSPARKTDRASPSRCARKRFVVLAFGSVGSGRSWSLLGAVLFAPHARGAVPCCGIREATAYPSAWSALAFRGRGVSLRTVLRPRPEVRPGRLQPGVPRDLPAADHWRHWRSGWNYALRSGCGSH